MSLRDRLAARQRPTVTFLLRIDEDGAALAELAAAQAVGAPERVAAAEAAVEACYERLTINALPPADLEALVEAHPPSEAERDKKIFNMPTFLPALLAACVDSDITEDEWATLTTKGPLTQGETTALFQAAWEINYRSPDPGLPKG